MLDSKSSQTQHVTRQAAPSLFVHAYHLIRNSRRRLAFVQDTITPVSEDSPRRVSSISETMCQVSEPPSYRSETASALAVVGSPTSVAPAQPAPQHSLTPPKLDTPHALHTPSRSFPDDRVDLSYTAESSPLGAEAARLRWHAPPQLQERGRSLLQTLSGQSRRLRRPAQDMDSGLRLYEEDVLPPPYSAD
ncbi:hypothetical protein C8Q76DRAFT_762537 [Earliella scabrosa]|nr:hypothetical protein C8Q76DRAFT_762537 [Earliella scabrosa]